jgi:maltose O-acetyltransferase
VNVRRGRVLPLACNALFYGFARHLPYSSRPYALGARRIRYALCRHMFASCGANVNVEHGASIGDGSKIRIGDNSGIGLNAMIIGPVIIGDNVMMGPSCSLFGIDHETRRTDVPMIDQGEREPRPPVIEDDVWLSANVIVLPGRRIGRGSVIGAGAVVASDIPPYAVAAGNPARVIRYRHGGGATNGAAQRPTSSPVHSPQRDGA